MNKNIEKKKEFIGFEEQVSLLKKRKLKINSNKKLITFLKMYNYEHCINGYNDPFFKCFDRKTNIYIKESSSNQIIQLFDFDFWIKKNFIENILVFEQKFCTSIVYYLNKMLLSKYEQKSKNKEILEKITSGDLLNIEFPILKKYCFSNISKLVVKYDHNIKKSFSKSEEEKEKEVWKILRKKLLITDKKIQDKRFWKLSIWWSFGSINDIFLILSDDIKQKIISSSFNIDQKIAKKIFPNFYDFSYELEKIRNIIFHNNVLYNRFNMVNSKNISNLFNELNTYHNLKYDSITEFNLNHLFILLSILNDKKNWKQDIKILENLFNEHTNGINDNSRNYIKKKIFGKINIK